MFRLQRKYASSSRVMMIRFCPAGYYRHPDDSGFHRTVPPTISLIVEIQLYFGLYLQFFQTLDLEI